MPASPDVTRSWSQMGPSIQPYDTTLHAVSPPMRHGGDRIESRLDPAVLSSIHQHGAVSLTGAFDIQTERPPHFIRMPNGEQHRPGERRKADVLQGTLDLMVLQTLATLGPLHGYAIAARLEQVSGGSLQLNMGTLYPGLMRLEQRGFVRGAWGVTDNNRKARFYAVTAAGRRQLASERAEWTRMAAIMDTLLHGEG